MDKQNAFYPYNGIVFSLKKECSSYTCCSMDVPWKHYAKSKKPVTEDCVLYDSIYIKCPE